MQDFYEILVFRILTASDNDKSTYLADGLFRCKIIKGIISCYSFDAQDGEHPWVNAYPRANTTTDSHKKLGIHPLANDPKDTRASIQQQFTQI